MGFTWLWGVSWQRASGSSSSGSWSRCVLHCAHLSAIPVTVPSSQTGT